MSNVKITRNSKLKDALVTKKGKTSIIAMKLCDAGMETVGELFDCMEFAFDIKGLGQSSLYEIFDVLNFLMTDEEKKKFHALSIEYQAMLKEKAKESQRKYLANKKANKKANEITNIGLKAAKAKQKAECVPTEVNVIPKEIEVEQSEPQEQTPVQEPIQERRPVIMGLMFSDDELEMISVLVSNANGPYSRIKRSIMDKIQNYYDTKHPAIFESKHPFPVTHIVKPVEDDYYIDPNTYLTPDDLDIFRWIKNKEYRSGKEIATAVRFGINAVMNDSEEQYMLIDFYNTYIKGANGIPISFNAGYKLYIKDNVIKPVRFKS